MKEDIVLKIGIIVWIIFMIILSYLLVLIILDTSPNLNALCIKDFGGKTVVINISDIGDKK